MAKHDYYEGAALNPVDKSNNKSLAVKMHAQNLQQSDRTSAPQYGLIGFAILTKTLIFIAARLDNFSNAFYIDYLKEKTIKNFPAGAWLLG